MPRCKHFRHELGKSTIVGWTIQLPTESDKGEKKHKLLPLRLKGIKKQIPYYLRARHHTDYAPVVTSPSKSKSPIIWGPGTIQNMRQWWRHHQKANPLLFEVQAPYRLCASGDNTIKPVTWMSLAWRRTTRLSGQTPKSRNHLEMIARICVAPRTNVRLILISKI
jgi:hypothetical protein